VKKFASQGQQKSLLVALKLAQCQFIKEVKKVSPILLLDDINDKLDNKRLTMLMEIVSSNEFGQIFITDTHLDRMKNAILKTKKEALFFNISENYITTLI
jgi:DNA replication and repair protein RecF